MSSRPIRPTRRLLLALPLGAIACAGRDEPPAALPPLVSGYGHLTPIRLNVASLALIEPAPGAVRVDEPAPLNPAREMRRMAEERLVAMGNEGEARFLIRAAEFRRERLAPPGGLTGLFAGEPGERLTCRLMARLELRADQGQRNAFVEAEARRTRSLPEGTSAAARRRAAEEVVRQGMDDLNVELEFQVRRSLRDWLSEAAVPAPAAIGPGGIQREELPRRR
jgi:hypothetical protein